MSTSPEISDCLSRVDMSPVWAMVEDDIRRHAEQEWPGEGLNAVARATFVTRGGHAPSQRCAIDNGLRYDDA